MKFDDDLMAEVKAQAPQGVEFEDAEVRAALVRAVNGPPLFPLFATTTAVQRAATRAVQRRKDEAAHAGTLVHAHWPRFVAERGACGVWARKQGDGLDDSKGYADTTCPACIERLVTAFVPLADSSRARVVLAQGEAAQ